MNLPIKYLIYLLTFVNVFDFVLSEVYILQPGERIVIARPSRHISANIRDDLNIFCYEGRPKYIIHIWQSVSLLVDHKSDNYVQYDGSSPDDVQKEFIDRHSSWSVNPFSLKHKHFRLNPFNNSCIGIESNESFSVNLHLIRIDYWKVLLLIAGICLFYSAPKLSNNSLFYYLSGISLGTCASFLILIFFVSKMFPKRPMMYGFIVGGWTVGIYLLQLLWENIRVIATTYMSYVLWYAFTTGLISFVICYRLGPVTNPRSKNLIKWALQLLGLVLIFNSSHFQEASMGMVVFTLIVYNFPKTWIRKSQSYWNRKFPPKVSPLTNDQYYQQGLRETTKALNELRQYCSSPECNQWKTVLKLQNVKRFASFVEGNSHLSDQEIIEYDGNSLDCSNLTDDDEMTDDST